jgi:hypothetical protein
MLKRPYDAIESHDSWSPFVRSCMAVSLSASEGALLCQFSILVCKALTVCLSVTNFSSFIDCSNASRIDGGIVFRILARLSALYPNDQKRRSGR